MDDKDANVQAQLQPVEPDSSSRNSTTDDTVVATVICKSPWPYLDAMFQCISASNKICKFMCLLCKPRPKDVSAYANSPSNLRKHIEVC
jgi:hypothetical protein